MITFFNRKPKHIRQFDAALKKFNQANDILEQMDCSTHLVQIVSDNIDSQYVKEEYCKFLDTLDKECAEAVDEKKVQYRERNATVANHALIALGDKLAKNFNDHDAVNLYNRIMQFSLGTEKPITVHTASKKILKTQFPRWADLTPLANTVKQLGYDKGEKRIQSSVIKILPHLVNEGMPFTSDVTEIYEVAIQDDKKIIDESDKKTMLAQYYHYAATKPEVMDDFTAFMSDKAVASKYGIECLQMMEDSRNIPAKVVPAFYKSVLPNIDATVCEMENLANLARLSNYIWLDNPDDTEIGYLNNDVQNYVFDEAKANGDVNVLAQLVQHSGADRQIECMQAMAQVIFNVETPEDLSDDYDKLNEFLDTASAILRVENVPESPTQLIEFYADKELIAQNQQTMRWIREWDMGPDERESTWDGNPIYPFQSLHNL